MPEALDSLSITSELIRAARALLRWEQRDLANASGVSLPTIKRLESAPGTLAAHSSTVAALRRALESAGIEFTNGNGPGVVAKDDPLTYVPADTPYVFANIDAIPTDISSSWMAQVDKDTKVGDMYAEEINALEKIAKDEDAKCAASAEPSPADAASGGGGGALQDAPASGGDEASSPADQADAAASSPAGDEAGAAPPVADLSAPSSFEATNKCSPAQMADRAKAVKALEALKAEVAGKDIRGVLDIAGLSTQAHFAIYGIGLVPVARIELAKPANLRGLITRMETATGERIPTAKVAGLDYWAVGGDKPDSKLKVVFAISGNQLVATIAPRTPNDADLRILFGLDKPKRSLADDGGLAAMNKKLNYLTYGSGYFDSAKLVAVLKAPPTPLETSFLTAMGEKKPAIDATCSAEYDQLAAMWPRASFGYSELAAKHMALRGVVETNAEIAKDLMSLRAPMPGLPASPDALFDLGFSANLGKLPELANKYADRIQKSPWKCESLAHMNQGAEQTRASLTNPSFAGMTPMFHGFHAIFDKLDMKDDQPVPDIAGVVAIGSDNPAGLLGYANSLPGMADLGLKPDGVAKQLPPMPNLPVKDPMFVAMTDKVLALSIGTGEEAKLPAAMKSDPAQQPLAVFGAKGDIYHLIAQIQRKAGRLTSDPNAQQMAEQQAKMMDAYAKWIKHLDLRLDLTETGIEFKESIDAQ